jgi:hypothetical protein
VTRYLLRLLAAFCVVVAFLFNLIALLNLIASSKQPGSPITNWLDWVVTLQDFDPWSRIPLARAVYIHRFLVVMGAVDIVGACCFLFIRRTNPKLESSDLRN